MLKNLLPDSYSKIREAKIANDSRPQIGEGVSIRT